MSFAQGWRVADRITSVAMTVLGIVLALVPLALWVAWSGAVLTMVVVVGAVCAALLVVLAESENRSVKSEQEGRGVESREALADEAIAELHRIFPLTYHHSLNENARFRGAMERMLHLIKAPTDRKR